MVRGDKYMYSQPIGSTHMALSNEAKRRNIAANRLDPSTPALQHAVRDGCCMAPP